MIDENLDNVVQKEQLVLFDKSTDKIVSLVDRLDFLDIQILRKFYITDREFPNDTQPYCFPVLFMEMKVNNNLKIGSEALRKRLDTLSKHGLLKKMGRTNPANYLPVAGVEEVVRALVKRFFIISGLYNPSNI